VLFISEYFEINSSSCIAMGCHLGDFCDDVNITIQTSGASKCCELGGRSFNDGTCCVAACELTSEFLSRSY